MATIEEQRLMAQMCADLGTERRHEMSTAEAGNDNSASQDAVVKQAFLKQQQTVERLSNEDPAGKAVKAWNNAILESDPQAEKLEDRWSGQGHRAGPFRVERYDEELEQLVEHYGSEERARYHRERQGQGIAQTPRYQSSSRFGRSIAATAPPSRQRAASPRAQGSVRWVNGIAVGHNGGSSSSATANLLMPANNTKNNHASAGANGTRSRKQLASSNLASAKKTTGFKIDNNLFGTKSATTIETVNINVSTAPRSMLEAGHDDSVKTTRKKQKKRKPASSVTSGVSAGSTGLKPSDILGTMGVSLAALANTESAACKESASMTESYLQSIPATLKAAAVEEKPMLSVKVMPVPEATTVRDLPLSVSTSTYIRAKENMLPVTLLPPPSKHRSNAVVKPVTALAAEPENVSSSIIRDQTASTPAPNDTKKTASQYLTFEEVRASLSQDVSYDKVQEVLSKLFCMFRYDWLKQTPFALLPAVQQCGHIIRVEMFNIALLRATDTAREKQFRHEFGFILDLDDHFHAARKALHVAKINDPDIEKYYDENSHYKPFYELAKAYYKRTSVQTSGSPEHVKTKHQGSEVASSIDGSVRYVATPKHAGEDAEPRNVQELDLPGAYEKIAELMETRSIAMIDRLVRETGGVWSRT